MIAPTLFYEPVRVHYGDIWQLGQHRLLCGDATNAQDVERLFDGEHFALCFTSPPYSDQREYKSGPFDWHKMMCGAFDQMIAHGKPDCHILINLGLSHKNRQVDMYWLQWLLYCASVGWPLFGWYVWDQGSGLPGEWGGRLAPSHEFIFHFNKKLHYPNKWIETKYTEQTSKRKNKTALRRGRKGTITDYVEVVCSPDAVGQPYKIPDSVICVNRECARGIHTQNHPAVFPVAFPEFIMQTWSQPDDIVYEPFCGSGTSIIAAENLHRKCYAVEISEEYCNLAIDRWQQATAQQAKRIM